jgi:hypothetical protein
MKYLKSNKADFTLKVLEIREMNAFGIGFTDNAEYWGLPSCDLNSLCFMQFNLYLPDCYEISEDQFIWELEIFKRKILAL